MRPQKSTTCQYIDADTGTLCPNPVAGQGRWRFCSEEHFTLARKQYKLGRNASDLRLHRLSASQRGGNPFNVGQLEQDIKWMHPLDYFRLKHFK